MGVSEPNTLTSLISLPCTFYPLPLTKFSRSHRLTISQRVASCVEPDLNDKYIGTSPRLLVPNTSHVFSASEFPGPIVIPVHCEMSFTNTPPPTIMFYAHRAPDAGSGGETPLADFQAVWSDLPATLREEFQTQNIMNVRSYFSDENININPLMTKSWQKMFETTNRFACVRVFVCTFCDLVSMTH